VTDGSSTGTSISQSTSQSPWLPTTALRTWPTHSAITDAVYATVYVPGSVPAASVHSSSPVHTNGVGFAASVEVCAPTVPNVRPVATVSVRTRSAPSCDSLSVAVVVSVRVPPTATLLPYTAPFRSVTDGSSTGTSISQSTSQSPW